LSYYTISIAYIVQATIYKVGIYLRFFGPQLDISRSCRTIDTESVRRAVCLFTSPSALRTKLYYLVTEAEQWGENRIRDLLIACPSPQPLRY